ncbi:MAG TPA: DHH family phosphoesterase, partial [Nitrososphaerales archaeon]|nr:DHH family phosphoesterase [Nitrososphaerales archaeon]
RDAREFGTLLNSCGRMGKAAVGASICLGDRAEAMKDAMKTLSEYRLGLTQAIAAVSTDPTKLEVRGSLVLVRGEGLVDERILGPVISILTSSPVYGDKVVVGTSLSGGADLKVSAREGDAFPGEANLGLVMKEAATIVGGIGGGHSMAAGAKIPASRASEFIAKVQEMMGS